MCIEDFSVAESVAVSLPLKRKKDITICDARNGKILVRKGMRERTPSLLKSERKSKKFLCRFELAIAFLKDANQAEKYAQQENPERIRGFLKKIGSNFRITERTLSFPLKNAWILAGKYHAEAQRAKATSYDFSESTNWRCAFEKIRTDFAQNL